MNVNLEFMKCKEEKDFVIENMEECFYIIKFLNFEWWFLYFC